MESTKGIKMKLGLYIDASERKCRALILTCIFTVLSSLNHLLFSIMDACPGHILESTIGIEKDLGL